MYPLHTGYVEQNCIAILEILRMYICMYVAA
jgi:hypothetical protein